MPSNPTIPEIAKAYENDPRTLLSQGMIQQGSNTAPVAGGKYAWVDGIARALSGVAGGYIQKKNQKKFAERERAYAEALSGAINPSIGGVPKPPMEATMGGYAGGTFNMDGQQLPEPPQMAPPQMPPQVQDNPLMGQRVPTAPDQATGPVSVDIPPSNFAPPQPQMPPQAPPPQMAPPQAPVPQAAPPQMAPPPQMPTQVPQQSPRPQAPPMGVSDYFLKGIVPIEGGTNKDGSFKTSPAGAIGPAQVMPGTAREAAKLAGLAYNDKLYRTDAAYNLKLGEAYYAEQVKTFGDPIKAAAAYNAGPGGVRRAERRARKSGKHWEEHLPNETKMYLNGNPETGYKGFKATIAAAGGDAGGMPQEAMPAQPPVQMEQEGPAPQLAQKPNAPDIPDAVQSQRLSVAQRLLKSGNPDLVSLAQGYLDKGFDEQFTSNTNRNSQEFTQSQTEFGSELANFNASEGDSRQDAFQSNRDVRARNFERERGEDQQAFQSAENVINRRHEYGVLGYNRQTSKELAKINNDASYKNVTAQIEASKATREEKNAAKQQQFFSTPTGAKLYEEATTRMSDNDATAAKLRQILPLLDKVNTGGAMGLPFMDSIMGTVNSNIAQFNALTSAITVQDSTVLKGSLSDSDRAFVLKGEPSVKNPIKTNRDLISARLHTIERQNDFEMSRLAALAEGRQTDFTKEWNMYKRAVSVKDDNYLPFEQWKQGIPQYDAKGNKVN